MKKRNHFKEIMNDPDIIINEQDVRDVKMEFNTTYKLIHEFLSAGIGLDDIVELMEIHRDYDFPPSMRALKVLFCHLNYDFSDFLKSMDLMEEYWGFFEKQVDEEEESSKVTYLPYTEKFKVATRVCYSYIRLLELHDNSPKFVEDYLERENDYYHDTDDEEEPPPVLRPF